MTPKQWEGIKLVVSIIGIIIFLSSFVLYFTSLKPCVIEYVPDGTGTYIQQHSGDCW